MFEEPCIYQRMNVQEKVMSQISYGIDPSFFAMPSREELVDLRIWDLHYHGLQEHERAMQLAERMGIERVFALDIGGGWYLRDPATPAEEERHRKRLEEWKDRMAGIIRIDPSQPKASLDHMEKWIADGPCVGIKYAGGNQGGVTCDHPNNDRIIARAHELEAVIYIHTWLKVGEDPRYPGAGNNPGESTPMDVAKLAERFPEVPLICGHSGGDWEFGARAIRAHDNVLFEFAGSPPWSGMVDYAHNWLGEDRLVWGGHITSRSYSNELSKVFDADLNDRQRKKVLGENLRRIAVPIMQRKGYDVSV
jgi:predicted TIM-barrel fold metal-dependent hydrolase